MLFFLIFQTTLPVVKSLRNGYFYNPLLNLKCYTLLPNVNFGDFFNTILPVFKFYTSFPDIKFYTSLPNVKLGPFLISKYHPHPYSRISRISPYTYSWGFVLIALLSFAT